MQVEKESQFKVDNWGTFFLHRLFLLYEKGEKCDGTLLFKSGQSIKVHKLVLSTCTDYFDESVWKNETFTLPPVLSHGAVLPIINFMYTGFLNCSAELNNAVFTAAKFFNVTVLIKLMHAQMGGDVNPPKPSTDLGNTSTPTKTDESASAAPSTPTPSPAPSPSPAETPASVIKLKKLPTSAKPLFVTPQPSTSSSVSVAAFASTSQSVPGKKLPFWKKRTTTAGGGGAGSPVASGGSRLKQGGTPPPVVASPCRFEADRVSTSGDKAGFQPHTECSSFSGINYIDEPVYKTSSSPKPIHQLTTEFNNLNKKRSHDRIQCDEIEDIDEDDVDGDLTCAETVVMVAKGGASAEDKFDRLTKMATTPKPILKPLTSDSVTAGVVGCNIKKVRFSLVAEGKENTESANSVTPAASPALGGPAPSPSKPAVVGGAKEPVAMATAYQRVLISGDKSANLNASQIISEVMKKNPNLMKNNKNFRVLVSGAGKKVENGGGGGGGGGGETKVKLIVMKPQTLKSQPTAAAVKSSSSNAENTTGPWLCNECGVAGQPMCFETYYLYRRHLHDVHQQRIDARICEYCGYKSSKRNLHLYHLYTKHDVPPPRNIRFPKCDKCNYIALSDSLLIKHNNNHATSSEKLSCKPCKVAFRSQAALQAHNQTCAHCKEAPPGAAASPTKEYSCQYCGKTFNRSINLKAHMRIAHNNESRSLYEEEEEEVVSAGGDNDDECSSSTANLLQVIRLPMVEGVGIDDGGEGGQRTLLLPAGVFLAGGGGGDGGEGTPSSEQEAMSTVASGIATSINLNDASHLMAGDQTVILLDGSSELVLSNTVMLTTPPDGSTSTSSNACAGEYIVPEVMSTTNQLFQTVTMSSSAEGGLPEGASIIVVPPDNHMIVDQDSAVEQTAEEQQSSSDPVTTSHQQLTTTEDDKCTNIVEEACKRSTIIIETSSVVTGAQKSDSVIVSAQTPRIDLSDWDDMDTSSGRCDNPDERPVRVTLERMPDII